LTQRERIFSPSTGTSSVKLEQSIAWPRREKIKAPGEKVKTQGEKYHIFSPSWNTQILSQKKIVSSGKNMI
jgi:hypothetical protein